RYGIRPILGASLGHHHQHVTALVADAAGYRNLCRIISSLQLGEAECFSHLLAENAAGLHLLIDNPSLFQPLLTDAFPGRLWTDVGDPGLTETAMRDLVEAGRTCGARPVATHGCSLPSRKDDAAPLVCSARLGVPLKDPRSRPPYRLWQALPSPKE